MSHPDWVIKHKTKGTEIRNIKDKYYLYKVSSKWDKNKKRAQKVTGEYLGSITKEGLIPPKHKRTDKIISNITVKEYGTFNLFYTLSKEIRHKLIEIFPDSHQMIYVISFLRLINRCPFKRIEHHYTHSYISEIFPDIRLSGKNISLFLRDLGNCRGDIVEFMNYFTEGTSHILFDATNIFSRSENMDINRLGYNRKKSYVPQINLLYAFSCDKHSPVYYRILPGNIRDITAFSLSMIEAGLKDAVVVADKGFASNKNIELLDGEKLKYIIPLKRNSSLLDDEIIRTGDRSMYEGYFLFQKRPIWYYSYDIENSKKIVIYMDEKLRAEEEKDYLQRIEKNLEGYSIENFYEKQYRFGTLAVIENTAKSCEDVYETYKSRDQIEKSFDVLKSTLSADSSYMQDEQALESWAFLNHISLMMIYKIYSLLKEKKLLSKYSADDLINHLKYIHKVRINQQWMTSEITKKTKDLLDPLGVDIT